ncbi:MAG: hypothetical protein H6571_21945 [Lewinellaceae bacterium]|nr:hypothetical protein [Lewinellaceae bacterium]
MDLSEIKSLKQAISIEVKNHIENLGTFKNFEIDEVRSVFMEDRYFNHLSNSIFQGTPFKIDFILGTIDIVYRQGTSKIHNPSIAPRFAVSNLMAQYNHKEKKFEVLGLETLK